MGSVMPLDVYRAYLEALDDEAQKTLDDEDYLDLLTPDEVIDLLCVRDKLSSSNLSPDGLRQLKCLDDLLIRHHRLVVENIPPYPDEPRAHWWWHLHEGPQVRDEALAATRDA